MDNHLPGHQFVLVYLKVLLGHIFFLIYINDLSKDISSTVKRFADDTSIFSLVDDVNVSVVQLKMVSAIFYRFFNFSPKSFLDEIKNISHGF